MTITDTVIRGPVKKDRPAPVTRTVTRRNVAGDDLGSVDLEPSIFGIEPNLAVLHQVVTAQLAAIRAGTQSTKTRAEVRGGGAKPFAQKGTGRARQGSSRSPSMSGGGIALGPKPRSYRQHTPKKMVRLALLSALSDRAANDRVGAGRRVGLGRSEDQGRRGRPAQSQDHRRPCSSCWPTTRPSPGAPSPTCPTSSTTSFGQLSAHDVLRNDWILVLRPHAARLGRGGTPPRRPSRPRRRKGVRAKRRRRSAVDGVTESDTGTADRATPSPRPETEEADTDA